MLRTKSYSDKSGVQSRLEDYEKIIHLCQEKIRQLSKGW
ncbi:hypothetical protein THIOSC13_1910001 [uncultured Thiomicrorhabdus sp.]